jgi:hypothetical protein
MSKEKETDDNPESLCASFRHVTSRRLDLLSFRYSFPTDL